MARPFGDGGVVGQIHDTLGGGGPMGGENEIEPERLRRLHRPQPRPRRRRGDKAVRIDFLDCVGNRRARNGGAVGFRRGDRPRN